MCLNHYIFIFLTNQHSKYFVFSIARIFILYTLYSSRKKVLKIKVPPMYSDDLKVSDGQVP